MRPEKSRERECFFCGAASPLPPARGSGERCNFYSANIFSQYFGGEPVTPEMLENYFAL